MAEEVPAPPADAIAAVTHPDPWPYYRRLRERNPFYFDETLKLWVASSHAVIEEALHQKALQVRPPAEPVPAALAGNAVGDVFGQLVRMTDGDFHAAHKPAVLQAAQRWSLADVAQATRATLKQMEGASPGALLAGLPVQVMARLLGVPADALDSTCLRAQQFTQAIAPGATPQAVAAGADAAGELMAQGRALGLVPAQAANRIAFMQQSIDATAGLMGHTFLMLADQPGLVEAADASPLAMRGLVAEVERYCSPIQNTRRFAAAPVLLAGQAVPAGQGVLLVLASANRDERLNARPDEFDPQRADRRSMGFGAGAHACPGASIAIEIVATAVSLLRAGGRFGKQFSAAAGFRPLANARIPVFAA